MKQLVGVVLLLASVQVSRAGDTKPVKKGPVTTRTTLPENHEDQRVLRKYLATLTEKDFAHGINELVSDKFADTDAENLYRNHVYTMLPQPLVGTKRGVPAVNAPPRLFLLSSLETKDGVMQPPVWPECLIAFVQWDNPGNPYRNNRGLKLRAFATATVMMTMIDDTFEHNPLLCRGDWFAYQLVYCGLPYPGFKDVLPAEIQKAYEAGLKRLGERVISWGVKGEEPYADLIGPFGLHCAAKALNDPAFTKAAEAYARKLYAMPHFNPAGYWTFRGGVDVPFDGQTRFFAATTALATDWPFAKDALERTYKLRSHLILPEPDGKLTGPSHFNSRLGGPASVDQWAWSGARDIAAAMITDEAAHLVEFPGTKELSEAPGKRARQWAEQIRENPYDKGKPIANDVITSHPWKWRVWITFNFPASVNPGNEFYRKGAYAHQLELRKQNSPLLKGPFERGETFIRAFGDKEFFVTKQPTFAAILHTGPIGHQDPSEKFHQYKGPLGLSGGQLSAFWTPQAGSVILGQRGGMTYEKSLDLVPEWRTWPIHAVSGQTPDGVVFTSARIQKPEVIVHDARNLFNVQVRGVIPASIVGQDKSIAGKYRYGRHFVVGSDSVRVTTTLEGDDKERIAELYETIPVYLRDVREQVKATPTFIEFRIDGKWTPATEKFVRGVEAIKLTRFKGAVLINFDRPRRVKLSPADWTDEYLSRGSARNVMIDMLENNDQPDTVAIARGVRYTISAER